MLNLYLDPSCTIPLLPPLVFLGDGATKEFALTPLLGSQVGDVWLSDSGFTNIPHNILGWQTTDTSIIFTTAPTSSKKVYVLPTGRVGMNFGGAESDSVTVNFPVWMKRTPGWAYSNVMVFDYDHENDFAILSADGITFAGGIGTGFSGLPPSALIGRACVHNNTYAGMVTANDDVSVTLDTSYTGDSASVNIFTVGTPLFAPDVSGSPGTFAPVLTVDTIDTDTPVPFWFQDTITIPSSLTYWPNNTITTYGQEILVAL